MRPHTSGGVWLSFLGDGDAGADRTRVICSAEHFQRLGASKARSDPHNVFRFNDTIAPLATAT